ncbi:hypothetical protein AB4K20DRAFT_1976049 [Rhizopus microsporus]|uniref:Uncharacterized protein n=1 Tax=Rhizopus microsporus TaxID=58291 RepID=A0A1X0RX70_RHIZD|nr:hypothetical protein BCV71DRAFT_236484 [Rhizopus microsporus]
MATLEVLLLIENIISQPKLTPVELDIGECYSRSVFTRDIPFLFGSSANDVKIRVYQQANILQCRIEYQHEVLVQQECYYQSEFQGHKLGESQWNQLNSHQLRIINNSFAFDHYFASVTNIFRVSRLLFSSFKSTNISFNAVSLSSSVMQDPRVYLQEHSLVSWNKRSVIIPRKREILHAPEVRLILQALPLDLFGRAEDQCDEFEHLATSGVPRSHHGSW